MSDEFWQKTMDRWCRVQWQILLVQAILLTVIGGGGIVFLYWTSRTDMGNILQRLDAIEAPLKGMQMHQNVNVDRGRTRGDTIYERMLENRKKKEQNDASH